MYHHVGEGRGVWWVSPTEFEEHLRQLKAGGYETVLPEEVVAAFEGKGKLPTRPVMVTFDDGYVSTREVAEPLLARYGFRGVVFLITDYVAETAEARRKWDGEPCLTWEEVRRMHQRGVLTFGGHGHTHANLAAHPNSAEEIERSFRQIRRKGGFRPVAFSYPHGAFGEETWKAVEKGGYRMAVVCEDRIARVAQRKDLFHLPRISIYGGIRNIEGGWVRNGEGQVMGWTMTFRGTGQPFRLVLRRVEGGEPLWESGRFRLKNGEQAEFLWGELEGASSGPLHLEIRDGSGLFLWGQTSTFNNLNQAKENRTTLWQGK